MLASEFGDIPWHFFDLEPLGTLHKLIYRGHGHLIDEQRLDATPGVWRGSCNALLSTTLQESKYMSTATGRNSEEEVDRETSRAERKRLECTSNYV
jgi:hypothetical protein